MLRVKMASLLLKPRPPSRDTLQFLLAYFIEAFLIFVNINIKAFFLCNCAPISFTLNFLEPEPKRFISFYLFNKSF